MVHFIDEYRDVYGVEPICRVIPIASSTYYAFKAREADPSLRSVRAKRDAELEPEIHRATPGKNLLPCRRWNPRQIGRPSPTGSAVHSLVLEINPGTCVAPGIPPTRAYPGSGCSTRCRPSDAGRKRALSIYRTFIHTSQSHHAPR